MIKLKTLHLPLFLFIFCSSMQACNLPPVMATLEATIVDPDDANGSNSSYATVNFTEFNVAGSDGGGTELQFRNPEGDRMTITIPDAIEGNYTIGALTQITAVVTVTRNQQAVTQTIQASAGTIDITGIAKDGSEVIAAAGEFEVNLEGGGAATGIFDGRR